MFDFTYTIDKECDYPTFPFSPDQDYPEFNGLFKEFDCSNHVYKNIRNLFIKAGYDRKNLHTTKWNPFRDYINDGQVVVIKPNLVYQETKEQLNTNCLTTHPSIIRPILDYLVLLQIKDNIQIKIVIADAPIQGADFSLIILQNSLKQLIESYITRFKINLEILDLRSEIAIEDATKFIKKIRTNGDPLGYTKVQLKHSCLDPIIKDYKKFGASGYAKNETSNHHKIIGNHYYQISNTILTADLFINIPKVKTHKKAGITIALKNLIGITGEKGWIPHFRIGSIKHGGDEFDDNQIWLKTLTTKANRYFQSRSKFLWVVSKKINKIFFKKFFRKDLNKEQDIYSLKNKPLFLINGDWFGNDTIWRPILDLNHILIFSDKAGRITEKKTRKYICITDGVIVGEGNGPLDPMPKKLGLISISENPVLNDVCISRVLGFDWLKIPQLKRSTGLNEYFGFTGNVEGIKICCADLNNNQENINFNNLPNYNIIAPSGWIYHIELQKTIDLNNKN